MADIDQLHHLRNPAMKPQPTFSPTSLRYIAALRGNKLKNAGVDFTYAEMLCADPEKLVCLAASNPEGRFYGFVANDATRRTSEELASQMGTFNMVFLVGSPTETLARLANGSSLPPMLDYLCCDENAASLSEAERTALYDLAAKRLNPGGLFVTSYRPYEKDDGALAFLVNELAAEMDGAQKEEFLLELKKLGILYWARNPDLLQKLDAAIAASKPSAFFDLFAAKGKTSGTFDTMVAMGARGLTYAGDATLASNYVELVVPPEAQDIVIKCRKNMLYEPIKDLALDRKIRTDIWIKAPSERSESPAELFGSFAYGVTLLRDQIPASMAAQGKVIDLSAPLYLKLVDLMSIMPMGIGDFLSHSNGKGEKPEKIIEALQILVACGIASPMRGLQTHKISQGISQPRLVGNFNRHLDKVDLTDKDVWFASKVMGCAIAIPARDAFVMQALNRAGLANSVSALMPELRRIAHTDAARLIMQNDDPTPEIAQSLVREIVGKSLPQWYAYALLEAA